jgi:predicted ATP-binding protein involved in virulence
MKLINLHIINFRSLKKINVDFSGARNAIVFGPNGVGKTSILDCINLVMLILIRHYSLLYNSNSFTKKIVEMIDNSTQIEAVAEISDCIIEWGIRHNKSFYVNASSKDKKNDITSAISSLVAAYYRSNYLVNENGDNFCLLQINEDNTINETKHVLSANRLYDKTLNYVYKCYLDAFIEEGDHNSYFFKTYYSEGEKRILFILSDLVKSLVYCNSNSSNPLLGKGIVIIDGFDIHLYPIWQRKFLELVKRIFPFIQFIFTTYSPLLLGDGQDEKLFLLDKKQSKTRIMNCPSMYGKDCNQILNLIGLPERNEFIKGMIVSLFEAISNNNWEDADKIKKNIEGEIAGSDPELIRADVLLRRRKMKDKN